jgi:chemotaxis protein histidine kinase CheA
MESLNNKTNERNKTIDQQLKILGAMGNQEGAMHKLKQERAASEVEMLLQKTNRTQEENDKIIDLNTQRTVNEIENNNRIQKNREDLAKKNEEARLKEEERLKKQKELEDKLRLDTFIAKQKLQEADAQYLKNQEAEDIAAEKKELEKKAAIKKSQEELNAELFKLNLKHLQDVQANADAEKKIEQIKQEAKIKATVDTLNILSDVLGKESAAGKAIAISSALINTYLGITAGLKLGFPLAIPAVLAASVTGFKAVKSIIATKVPGSGGGGGSVPSMGSMAAPIKPEAQTTTLSSQSINQIGVASSRAFVLETDVTNNQERIQRLNRAARIN